MVWVKRWAALRSFLGILRRHDLPSASEMSLLFPGPFPSLSKKWRSLLHLTAVTVSFLSPSGSTVLYHSSSSGAHCVGSVQIIQEALFFKMRWQPSEFQLLCYHIVIWGGIPMWILLVAHFLLLIRTTQVGIGMNLISRNKSLLWVVLVYTSFFQQRAY